MTSYRDGTRHGIAMDPSDGLLRAGEPGVQVTWMDAKIGDRVVTQRIGKPVEINSLWYNAACIMADMAETVGCDGAAFRALAAKARVGFRRFIRPDGRGLYDVVDGPEGDDRSLRPNQIFAVSLTHSALDPADQAAVVAVCARELLTAYGLRSLAPFERDFKAHYRGGVSERDSAYHQGTVWAWLLGPFAIAEDRVTGDAAAALGRLEPLRDHLSGVGLGTVSEIFDGAAPHSPRGVVGRMRARRVASARAGPPSGRSPRARSRPRATADAHAAGPSSGPMTAIVCKVWRATEAQPLVELAAGACVYRESSFGSSARRGRSRRRRPGVPEPLSAGPGSSHIAMICRNCGDDSCGMTR